MKKCLYKKKPGLKSFLFAVIFMGTAVFMFGLYLTTNLTGYSVSGDKGTIRVNGEPAELGVYEGDKFLGYTPLQYKLQTGKHIITIKKYGFKNEDILVNVKSGFYTPIYAEPILICYDRDHGINEWESSVVDSYRPLGRGPTYEAYQFTDYCFDSQSVIEYYCEKQKVESRSVSCNGVCNKGGCY